MIKEKYINLFTDFDFSEVAKFGKKEREAYQQSLKYLRDMYNVVATARREGEQIGREQSKKEIAMAKEQTKRAEDKAKEAEDKTKEAEDKAIIAMIKNTELSDEAIANALGVPIKRVQELRKKTQ